MKKSGMAVCWLALALTIGCARQPWPQGMQSALYMRGSAEYEALCWQVYRQAWDAVDARVKSGATVAKDEQGRPLAADAATGKQLCVVMDLDETVLDNSAYQLWLYQNHQSSWTQESWTLFMNNHPDDIKLVPGAGDFIHQCEAAGVYVAFITNRVPGDFPGTIKTLRREGILLGGAADPADSRMQLKTAGSDKTARRALINGKFCVIAYCGDQLTDFDDKYSAKTSPNPALRHAQAGADRDHFGADWFVLPNPNYGDWMNVIDPEKPMKALEAGRGETKR